MRRRVKEQLKSWVEWSSMMWTLATSTLDTFEEKFVSVPEQGGGKLIPDGICNPGQVYTVSQGKSGNDRRIPALKARCLPGNRKIRTHWSWQRPWLQGIHTNTAFNSESKRKIGISVVASAPRCGITSSTIRIYRALAWLESWYCLYIDCVIHVASLLGRPTVSITLPCWEKSVLAARFWKWTSLANSLQVPR